MSQERMTPEERAAETQEWTPRIANMDHLEMAKLWRFAKMGHPLFRPPQFEQFRERFESLGGMTPELSKQIGWEEA